MKNPQPTIGRRTFLGFLAAAAAFLAAWWRSPRRMTSQAVGHAARYWRTTTTRD